jgi:hypothetical protein
MLPSETSLNRAWAVRSPALDETDIDVGGRIVEPLQVLEGTFRRKDFQGDAFAREEVAVFHCVCLEAAARARRS